VKKSLANVTQAGNCIIIKETRVTTYFFWVFSIFFNKRLVNHHPTPAPPSCPLANLFILVACHRVAVWYTQILSFLTLTTLIATPSFRLTCSDCKKNFPCEKLLELHVAEVHDTFFQAQAARRKKVFLCLVPGCSKAFRSCRERSQHLKDCHHYAMRCVPLPLPVPVPGG
jgi:hypothetical protein